MLRLLLVLMLALFALPAPGTAVVPLEPVLAPGEYVWHPEVAPQGPVVVVVSLDEQRLYVYRNGIAIGISTISSGRAGYRTPTGVYTILQKRREHYSNKYDNAPMPYMTRLTWDGVALHGGALPGYPASHGCIRLPHAFAERLFEVTRHGQTVVVVDSTVAPDPLVHPGLLAPVDATGAPVGMGDAGDEHWWNDAQTEGPIGIVLSLADREAHVLRNGVCIGRATLDVAAGFRLDGAQLLVMNEGYEHVASPLDHTRPRHRWSSYAVGGGTQHTLDELAAGLRVPPEFARRLYDMLVPGTTVLLIDQPLRAPTDAQPLFEADDF